MDQEMKQRILRQLTLKETTPRPLLVNSENLKGDISNISGDASEIYGDASGIWGDVSRLSGDVSGISGNVLEIQDVLRTARDSAKEKEPA